MSSENTLTGRNGKFTVDGDLCARVTQWQVTRTLASKSEWGDSDSAGRTNRAAGRHDSTFTAEGKYDTSDEVFDLFALCDNFQLTVNIDTGEVIGWTSAWGEDGISYRPGDPLAPVRAL